MERASSQSPHGHYVPLLRIVLAWVSALALASGHHGFYASLDNHPVTSGTTASLLAHSQAGASAIGTAFAFLVSSSLAVSAGTAFLQCAWRVARKRVVSISGLNAMWSSLTNIFAFLSLDFWRTAQGTVIVSALAWTFPLIVTFAPGTLTVETDVTSVSGPCQVPTFDWGATGLLFDMLDIIHDSTAYHAPSSLIQQIVGATFLGGQPLPATSPCGRNCSYLVSTSGPSYSCSVGEQNPSTLNWTSAVLNPQVSPPPYFAARTDITAPSSENSYKNWDFQAHYTNYTIGSPVADGGYNITCIAYNSTYNINYTFAGTTASVVIDSIIPQQLAGQMSSNNSVLGSDFTAFYNATASDYALPSSALYPTAGFNATTSYYAILDSIAAYAIGSMILEVEGSLFELFNYTPSTIQLGQTQMIQTATTSLANWELTWIPIEEIPPIFESLLQNITLSMLTGVVDRSQSRMTTCIYSNNNTHFVYNKRRLWLIYGLGLGVALLCDFFGIIALFQNKAFGGATGSNFGDFLAATRNPELNELNLNEPGRIRLQYGPVLSEGGRYAFGRPEALAVGGKESSLLGSM